MSLNRASSPFRVAGQRPAASMTVLLFAIAFAGFARAEDKKPCKVPRIDAKALAMLVQSLDKVEKNEFSWGWICWLMNDKLDPNAKMTFGIVQLNAGQTNPLHIHANCEEHLYVLSGSCEHRIGKKKVVMKAGDVIRIPQGVAHKATTFAKEPLRAVIVYSSGSRQFEIVDEKGAEKSGRSE